MPVPSNSLVALWELNYAHPSYVKIGTIEEGGEGKVHMRKGGVLGARGSIIEGQGPVSSNTQGSVSSKCDRTKKTLSSNVSSQFCHVWKSLPLQNVIESRKLLSNMQGSASSKRDRIKKTLSSNTQEFASPKRNRTKKALIQFPTVCLFQM